MTDKALDDSLRLLHAYRLGFSYMTNDIVKFRSGARENLSYQLLNERMIIMETNPNGTYEVLGERKGYEHPEDRFIRSTVSGHQIEKVGCLKRGS